MRLQCNTMKKTSLRKNRTKKTSGFFPKVRSRHPSHKVLRMNPKLKLPFRSAIRLGSTTKITDSYENGGSRIVLNTIEGIEISSSKFKMKRAFHEAGVKSAEFFFPKIKSGKAYLITQTGKEYRANNSDYIPLPLIAKINYGSRGRGMEKIDTYAALERFILKGDTKYYFEKFYNYSREYRLHVNDQGCFYACRKMIKSDAPKDRRWYRNSDHCAWYKEDNPGFEKPNNWDTIVDMCIKAVKACKLDFAGVDVRVQSAKGKNHKNPDFIIIEVNSAPSYGEITAERYVEEIPKMLKRKKKILNV